MKSASGEGFIFNIGFELYSVLMRDRWVLLDGRFRGLGVGCRCSDAGGKI